VLAFDGMVLADLATPCDLFSRAQDATGRELYDVRVCSQNARVVGSHVQLEPPYRLDELRRADTIIVPGGEDPSRDVPDVLLLELTRAARRGARIASVCSGAFVLAAAGLLDGLRATTHWLAADALARRYPRIEVDANVLYVDNGNILTSAGAAAAHDLCLYLVRRDFGAQVAAYLARCAVMPLERAGGQSQFIVHRPPEEALSLAPVLGYIAQNLRSDHALETIARRAGMSVRTLSRQFRKEVGTTPAAWVAAERVRRAQLLLETTAMSIEQIASEVGLGSASVLRERFTKTLGTTPQQYRRVFQADRSQGSARAV
jgi:transcriptional regulator GlxA family with amidase domain